MSNNAVINEIGCTNREGFYLFCFARSNEIESLKATGLDDRFPVFQRTFQDIATVLSHVSLEDFCGPLAKARLQDVSWVGARAFRHEEVIEQVLRHSPVLPARFGTIFSSWGRLENFTKLHHFAISLFLDRVRDKEEWAIKGFVDRDRAQKGVTGICLDREGDRLAMLSPGKQYFEKKRIEANARKALNRWLKDIAEMIFKELHPYASRFHERELLSCNATGKNVEMIFNWAYLIPKGCVDDFRKLFAQMKDAYEKKGLILELSGPWPPYSFCPSLDREEN